MGKITKKPFELTICPNFCNWYYLEGEGEADVLKCFEECDKFLNSIFEEKRI